VRVQVSYVGLIQTIAGTRTESVELAGEGLTVRDLLAALGERHGPPLQDALLDPIDAGSRLATVLVDGRRCTDLEWLLAGGQSIDVVLFGPPPQGG